MEQNQRSVDKTAETQEELLLHVHRFLLRLWLEFSLKVNDREETFL